MFETSVPTDKLYKFMTVLGLALVAYGINVSIDKFHEAEMSRIDALEKLQRATFSTIDFGQKVYGLGEIAENYKKIQQKKL